MGDINRLKLVLVEQKRTSKWLAEQLGTLQLFQSGVLIHLNHLWKRLSK